ncbi:hypothetical protein A2791_02190 [Candidatus Saccharibacteria bacterium RIFCSPHIGHO2_01_FULL_46_30]|nr:MAG: hypothetical protein A2791_02190 [Candidatus Saccharibacteria bacterium RIFCSPHIGHO2_01_FULL_46_30]
MNIVASNSELLYEQMICTLSPNHSSFLKDGDPDKKSLTGESFFVVLDEEGSEWLLKEPAGGDIFEDDIGRLSRVWQDGIREVYASNIARYIGYPTATAKLIVATIRELKINDRPFVAFEYLPNVKDVKRNMPEEFFAEVEGVENTYDIDFRPVLNWLLGSHTDNGRQGVVSGTDHKKYYAIDMTITSEAFRGYSHSGISSPDQTDLYNSIVNASNCDEHIHVKLGMCMSRFINESNQQMVGVYFEYISKLRDAELVLSLLIPCDEIRNEISNAIVEKTKAIIDLYERQAFHIR